MTIPLTLTLDAAAMGAEHIGYQVRVPLKGNGTVEPVTIARVLPLYNRPHHVRLEFAEYPGYHYDITGQVMLCAAVKPVPVKPAAFKVLHPRHAEVTFADRADVISYMDEMQFGAEYSDGVDSWMSSGAPRYEVDTGDRVDVWVRLEPAYVTELRRARRQTEQYGVNPLHPATSGYRDAIEDLARELGVDLNG